jgi:hypothetical protein
VYEQSVGETLKSFIRTKFNPAVSIFQEYNLIPGTRVGEGGFMHGQGFLGEDRDLLDSYGGEYGEVFQRNDVLYTLVDHGIQGFRASSLMAQIPNYDIRFLAGTYDPYSKNDIRLVTGSPCIDPYFISPKKEIIALIAYLHRLGRDITESHTTAEN